jgi:outer membrane protein OmpA-like peptidoglycan-associated protein
MRSRLPYIFFALAAALAIAAVVLLIVRPGVRPVPPPTIKPTVPAPSEVDKTKAALDAASQPVPVPDPETTLAELGIGLAAANPEDLAKMTAQAIESGDIAALTRLLGKDAADPETLARLKALAALPPDMRKITGLREVGELELNTRTRWTMRMQGAEPGRDSIELDLKREDGKWKIERIAMPETTDQNQPVPAVMDPLTVADRFIQALLVQQFESARSLVDPSTVSDAKLAGLCILFEEGGYRMRKVKPLRTMFQREDAVGFLANVEAVDGKETAQFALTLRRPSQDVGWRVTEINLDQMLADYSRRMGGGDIYYSPLVKNPAGGDTLALYFEFDEADMNPRTRRQLEIVAMILKADPGKRITLSGHTDALGTDPYNRQLSARRASVVRDFLIESGVEAAQIVTVAKGASQPRRPNLTETGEDNPEGRRANRRTEIYLDF